MEVNYKMTEENFFIIPRNYVLERVSPGIINFSRRVSYLDFEAGDLYITEGPLENRDGKILDNIDYIEGRKLVASRGLSLPSPLLMYKVIIPFLKEHGEFDEKLNRVLERMRNDYSEFLEGIISQNIGDKNCDLWLVDETRTEDSNEQVKKKISLPHKILDSSFKDYEVSGYFIVDDLDEFGFPKSLRQEGGFKYWGPQEFNIPFARELGAKPQYKVVPIRCAENSLDFLLNFRPRGHFNDRISVRGVKIQNSV